MNTQALLALSFRVQYHTYPYLVRQASKQTENATSCVITVTRDTLHPSLKPTTMCADCGNDRTRTSKPRTRLLPYQLFPLLPRILPGILPGKSCQESGEIFQSSLACRPLFGHQKWALAVVGVEKTAPLDPGRLPPLKPESDCNLSPLSTPCFVSPATMVLAPPTYFPRPPATLACSSPEKLSDLEDSDLEKLDLEDSSLWRWCHSAHDVVGKASLSQGMSSHRKNATCAFKQELGCVGARCECRRNGNKTPLSCMRSHRKLVNSEI